MDIVKFLENTAGKWFSQRTTHYLTTAKSQAGHSNLEIEFLASGDPAITHLCQQLTQNPAAVLCGLRIHQDSRLEGDSLAYTGSTVMVVVGDNTGQGRLLSQTQGLAPTRGVYHLVDEVLTVITEDGSMRAEEQFWFANPNLRMRTSILKADDQVQMTSFCSEIRMGMRRPPQE
ncbi:phycobiliprotein lyase [Halomicronema hongdechloris C2206]|uniref:Chromophore lyase CpcS/CpeS n=1 Tax=Halomicronema hongdechloris C2206 TaxID=1641165 RepID=A0A1Z3HKY0_9CYAN|nr:phycobiliprotein lyase [Halomicronema hongdechloris]ASC70916.1 phycobiliprotein lyase [Halomicronema hongdechloris C2206]